MNFANLEKEISIYKDLSKKVEQTLSKLSLFFKTFSTEGIIFLEKSKKSLDDFYQELYKENHTTTYNISFSNFYQDFKSFLGKIKEILITIDKNISNKISEYILEHQSVNEETTTKLYSMLVKLNENKSKLEKFKHNYFDACKIAMDQEKKIKGKNKYKEIISKYETISENQKQIYKEELSKYNKVLDENEEQYQTVINNYLKEYKNKLKFLVEMMNKFIEYGKNYEEIHKEILVKMERFIQFVNIKRDLEYFLKDINFINENKRRFLNEQFLDYEIFKKNIEKNANDKDLNNILNSDNPISLNISNSGYNISYEKSIKILELGKYENEEINVVEGEENKKIDGYITELLESENEIPRDKYIYLLQYVDNNNENITNFMDLLINHYKAKQFIKINNLENLKFLSNIICLIVSCSFNNKQLFDVCFIIMFISEKTIYFCKDNIFNKFYLCKILPNRTVFSSVNFWTELINVHISMLADVLTRKEIENREKLKESNKNSGMFSKVKNMFGNKKDLENQRIENEILYGQIYDEKLPNYCVKVLYDYINHFSNFNLEHKKATELIVDMSIKYKFDYSYVTYFMAALNSNLCVNINKDGNSLQQKEKNENTINTKIDYDELYKDRLDKKISKHITDLTMRIIIHSMKYLELDELPNLFVINKTYNKTLTKLIYKNLLFKLSKDLEISKHILIWKILLNYTETTTKYNYEEIKENITFNPKVIKNLETIQMDAIRTTFDSNNDLNQIRLGNLLKALEYTLPSVNYSQGMNYIGAFFLSITNNEEESFYLFLSLLISTEYGKLFEKDLEKFQKYFYVFDRLVCILLPELHYHFQENNISSSHFLTPWLITLFTHIYNTIKDRNNPLILLRIFDMFIFSGWKSVIKVGITLLKNYELKLMNLSSEELLSYLINGICKNVFFQNEYYDDLMNMLIKFKIDNYLISNIENEYELKESIPKIGGKDIFSTENKLY